jgi:peptidyl-prolyl isomerase E (cyclophilin E)
VDPISKIFRGFAFVEYEDPEDADHAIFNMHEAELEGAIVKVERARKRRGREMMGKPIWADETYFERHDTKT